MPKSTILYWGDNGVHEFWESEDHQLLIFKNHGETIWSAHRDQKYLFSNAALDRAARRVKGRLSTKRVWIKNGANFVLSENTAIHSRKKDSRKERTRASNSKC